VRLTVLGATGRTGAPLVAAALQRGHTLRCLVRDPAKAERLLPVGHDRLVLEVGDATEASAIERAVAGSSVVVDVTGPVRGGPKRLRTDVVANLLPAMERHRVGRLLFLTGAGVRVDGDAPGIADRAIRSLLARVQGEILQDGQDAVAAIAASPLDWTVVRAPRLMDAEQRGRVRTAANVGGGTGTTLGRDDLAAFLLDEAEQRQWVHRAPVVSW
jgi:putative NADH-flavin reductase